MQRKLSSGEQIPGRYVLLSPEAAENMRQWQYGGGFSLDASVAVEASDRAVSG